MERNTPNTVTFRARKGADSLKHEVAQLHRDLLDGVPSALVRVRIH